MGRYFPRRTSKQSNDGHLLFAFPLQDLTQRFDFYISSLVVFRFAFLPLCNPFPHCNSIMATQTTAPTFRTAPLNVVQTIVPLTTVYEPPISCFNTPSDLTRASDGYTYWQYDPSAFTGTSTSCYPPNFRLGLRQVYSPGVCPESYTVRRTITIEDEYQGLCCQR